MKSVKDTEIKEKYGIDDDNNDNLCHFVFINTMTLNLHLFLFFFLYKRKLHKNDCQ